MCRPQDNSMLDVNSFASVSTDLFGSTHHILYTLAHTHSTTPPHIYRHIMCTHIPHAHSHTHAQCIQTCAQCIHTCTLELHLCKVLVPRPYGARHPLLQPNRTKGKHTHTRNNEPRETRVAINNQITILEKQFVSNSSKEYAG